MSDKSAVHRERCEYPEFLRKSTCNDMLRASKKDDPVGRLLLHEELSCSVPSEAVIKALITDNPLRVSMVNESGSNAFHIACSNVKAVNISIFLDFIDIYPDGLKQKNNFGMLPIHKLVMVATDSTVNVVALLIDTYRDSLKECNIELQYPIHVALAYPRKPSVEVCTLLIEKAPIAIKKADKYGHLPIHKACAKAGISPEVVEILIEKYQRGLTYQDDTGKIPLHWALIRPNADFEIVYQLLESYPEGVTISDNMKRLPLDLYMSLDFYANDITKHLVKVQQQLRTIRRGEDVKKVKK